jgi:MinD-like ATPase involved in chromosome partitioning or flagellar assembly
MVVVTGAKAGVGATTVAVNLAAALADRGVRVLAVDAAQQRNDLGDIADIGRDLEFSLDDVATGKCDARDAIATSPAGMRVLASNNRGSANRRFEFRRNSATASDSPRAGQQRLLGELDSLRDEVDTVVVDAGYGLTAWSRRFWTQARLVLLVTTSDDASILAAYTALKLSAADGIRPPLRVLVNRTDRDREADDAVRRIEKSCQRFLSLSIEALPALPRHEDEGGDSRRRAPRVWETPHSPFGHAVLWMARDVGELLDGQNENPSDGTADSERLAA